MEGDGGRIASVASLKSHMTSLLYREAAPMLWGGAIVRCQGSHGNAARISLIAGFQDIIRSYHDHVRSQLKIANLWLRIQ